MRKLGLLVLLMVGGSWQVLLADYASKSGESGDFESTAVWSTKGKFNGAPPVNGDVNQALIIETGSIITRNGDFNPVTVTVKGEFIVNGNYTNNQWGGVTVENGGVLEIFGDLNASANVTVKGGGTLIVHGSLTSSNAGITSHGDIIVVGNFSTGSSTTVHNTGNLVVGGNFTHLGGGFDVKGDVKNDIKIYILNPDAVITAPSWSKINDPGIAGDLADFLTDEAGTDLVDVVNEVLVSVVMGYQWKTDVTTSIWGLKDNWSGNKVPTSNSSVRVKNSSGAYPEIRKEDDLIEVNNLTIEPGATLTLKPGAQLTVSGKLTIADGASLIMEHEYGEGGMSSLITNGEVVGKVKTKINLPQDQWFYLGSSRKDAVFSDFSAGADGVIINVYRANQWWGIKSGLASRALRPLEGMVTNYMPDNPDKDGDGVADVRVIEYEGDMHITEVSRTFDEQGFHLLANPYPAFVDWQGGEGWERVDVDPTIWYRAKIGEEMTFVTYNNDPAVPTMGRIALSPYKLTEITPEVVQEHSLIAPSQAVWIKTLKPGVETTILPSVRRHGMDISRLKSSRTSDDSVIRIEAQNSFSRDGAVIFFADGFTEGYDRGDAEKYFNDSKNIPEVYTRIDDRSLAINGLPALKENVHSIPLSVRNRVEGEVSLKFDLRYFNGEHSVYFEDKLTGAFLNVARNSTYEYSVTQTGEDHERFAIHLYKVTTDLEEVRVDNDEIAAGDAISIKSVAGKVLVSVGMDLVQQTPGHIEVYTIDGRKISEVPARSSRTLVILPNDRGVYIIRAQFGQLVKSERVVNTSK